MLHNYETEKITRKASDAAEYNELFGSSARDRHAPNNQRTKQHAVKGFGELAAVD